MVKIINCPPKLVRASIAYSEYDMMLPVITMRNNSAVPLTTILSPAAGAQILIDLGVKDMILLTNSKKSIVGIEGFGLKVVGQKPVPGRSKV